jgi:hypothetical protein
MPAFHKHAPCAWPRADAHPSLRRPSLGACLPYGCTRACMPCCLPRHTLALSLQFLRRKHALPAGAVACGIHGTNCGGTHGGGASPLAKRNSGWIHPTATRPLPFPASSAPAALCLPLWRGPARAAALSRRWSGRLLPQAFAFWLSDVAPFRTRRLVPLWAPQDYLPTSGSPQRFCPPTGAPGYAPPPHLLQHLPSDDAWASCPGMPSLGFIEDHSHPTPCTAYVRACVSSTLANAATGVSITQVVVTLRFSHAEAQTCETPVGDGVQGTTGGGGGQLACEATRAVLRCGQRNANAPPATRRQRGRRITGFVTVQLQAIVLTPGDTDQLAMDDSTEPQPVRLCKECALYHAVTPRLAPNGWNRNSFDRTTTAALRRAPRVAACPAGVGGADGRRRASPRTGGPPKRGRMP